MRLLSINTGSPQTVQIGERSVVTGIDKTRAPSAEITAEGLVGDTVADTRHHGGPDQAVYVYAADDYAWWEKELERTIRPGTFGDNLTLSTLGTSEVRIGDRYAIGQVVLEVTAPRIPCAVFANQMGVPDMVARFRRRRRPGLYMRVLAPGSVTEGDAVVRTAAPTRHVTLDELFDLHYDTRAEPDRIEDALSSPIAIRDRADLEERLARQR